jgi:signal transduction histidine kinase
MRLPTFMQVAIGTTEVGSDSSGPDGRSGVGANQGIEPVRPIGRSGMFRHQWMQGKKRDDSMRKAIPPYRCFRDLPIAPKLYFTVGIMAVLIGLELFALVFALHTLSSLRGYVGGEGLWSKAQKDAVFHLYRYGVSRSEQDYESFQQFMRVPLGDAKTRRELLTGHPNMAAARQGLLEGRIHPDDIDGMISLFVRFDGIYYISKAIEIWGSAQNVVMQLLPIAQELHHEITSPAPSEAKIDQYFATIDSINQGITASEDEFSYTLGEGSRWLERVVLRLLLATAVTVETTGLCLVVIVSRGIQKGLTEIIRAANSFSAGDLGARAIALSRDEIGIVANSFNEMADNLQKRVTELGELNQYLQHEIEVRERAETELRQANESLESRVAERTATLTQTVVALHKEAADRERAEAALRQSQKMEAIGQLTGGIAHDFNNMLASISGNLEMTRRRVAQGRTADLGRYIEAALGSTARAGTLTHRLLAFSRRQTLAPQPTNLNRMVQDMQELFADTLGPGIRIETKLSPEVWMTRCDPNQLESALLNLVINARDAMPGGGSLIIETANARPPDLQGGPDAVPRPQTSAEYVSLSVTDTGIGMTPEVLARAFDPFFTTKPLGQGTGLGLSMIYGFVRQSNGEVVLSSQKGFGATATIYLPRYKGTEPSTPAPAPIPVSCPPVVATEATVLIVEDEPNIRSVLVDLLEDVGYTVVAAEEGSSALKVVESPARIDLLVSDIGLPANVDGLKLANAARQRRPALKVLFITGYSEYSVVGDHLQAGSVQVLTKPFTLGTLASKVQSIINE